jgi:hypothetical protein
MDPGRRVLYSSPNINFLSYNFERVNPLNYFTLCATLHKWSLYSATCTVTSATDNVEQFLIFSHEVKSL